MIVWRQNSEHYDAKNVNYLDATEEGVLLQMLVYTSRLENFAQLFPHTNVELDNAHYLWYDLVR